MSRMREGFASIAETTGYLCRNVSVCCVVERAHDPAFQEYLQVPEQEHRRHSESNTDKGVVESYNSFVSSNPSYLKKSPNRSKLTRQRRPRNQRHRNPNQIGITIKRPTLHQIRTLAPKPFQHSPQSKRDKQRVPINQPRRSAQQLEIIREMLLARAREVLADRSCQEQDDNDGGRDPERPIKVRVALEDVEEVLARVEGCAAASEDLVGIDIEELLVEGYAPEKTFRGVLLVA